jgi:ADP-ribose pyrophosphatase YjhB (NUDIX family)
MVNKDCGLYPLNRVMAICNTSRNEILFIRNQDTNHANSLSLPGDFVRYGELAEDALRRSIMQQAALRIEPIEILGIYSNIDNQSGGHIIDSVFVCIITNFPDMEMKKGSAQFKWMDRDQIEETKNSIYNIKIVKDYYSWRIQKSTFWTTKI